MSTVLYFWTFSKFLSSTVAIALFHLDYNAKSLDLSGSWFRYLDITTGPGPRKYVPFDGCFEFIQNKSTITGQWYANKKAEPMAVTRSIKYWMAVGADGYVISVSFYNAIFNT